MRLAVFMGRAKPYRLNNMNLLLAVGLLLFRFCFAVPGGRMGTELNSGLNTKNKTKLLSPCLPDKHK